MNSKEMKKLNRADLLRIVVRQQEEIESLQQENEQIKEQLAARQLVCEQTGNLAEASLKIHQVFEAAQQAADTWLASVQTQSESAGNEI